MIWLTTDGGKTKQLKLLRDNQRHQNPINTDVFSTAECKQELSYRRDTARRS